MGLLEITGVQKSMSFAMLEETMRRHVVVITLQTFDAVRSVIPRLMYILMNNGRHLELCIPSCIVNFTLLLYKRNRTKQQEN